MSLQPTFATLYAFDVQHQTPALAELSSALSKDPPDDLDLELLAQTIRLRRGIAGVRWVKHPMTSDRYRWFGALEGTTQEGKIALLIPYCSDHECREGVSVDRSVALYATGDVGKRTVDAFVRQVFMNYSFVMAQKETESAAVRKDRFRF